MFKPKYTYTEKLVINIRKIGELIGSLNHRRFSKPVLFELEKEARALSSHTSTHIEGNPLPLTAVKKIIQSSPEHIRDSEKEVLNYNEAIIYLNNLIKSNKVKLDNKFILKLQKTVTNNLLPKHLSGRYREEPVFVNDPIRRVTVYWAPDHQDVPKLMDELIEFVNSNEKLIDPLIIAGIFHKHFVTIHPFIDGNGRTTRLLTKTLLAKMGLDTFELFSFENYYNNNITKYFEIVGMKGDYYQQIKNENFTVWLEYFTDGIIDELTRVESLLPKIESLSDRLEKHHQIILDLINELGVIKDSDYAKKTKRSKASRNIDFQKLIDLKLIERQGVGRATYYKLKDPS